MENNEIDRILKEIRVSKEYVKRIDILDNEEIYILLTNGKLYFNDKLIDANIKTIWFTTNMEFSISYENIIKCMNVENEITKYINDNDYQYKKILFTDNELVALTKENNIRTVITNLSNIAIDVTRWINVDDIILNSYNQEYRTILVLNNEQYMPLFISDNK